MTALPADTVTVVFDSGLGDSSPHQSFRCLWTNCGWARHWPITSWSTKCRQSLQWFTDSTP